jgi:hypothetical protein
MWMNRVAVFILLLSAALFIEFERSVTESVPESELLTGTFPSGLIHPGLRHLLFFIERLIVRRELQHQLRYKCTYFTNLCQE